MRSLAHNPALDGMRAIGMIVIMLSHMKFLPGGYVWIDSFFVMSGFLISSLLLIERDKTNTVGIKQFYLRRAVRLFPAYFVYLVVGAALVVALDKGGDSRQRFLENTLTSLFYVNNYYRIWHVEGGTWFEHMWSLSVEEQFYLLWPLVFAWLARSARRRDNLLPILLAAIAFFTLWRVVLISLDFSHYYIYGSLETRADELLTGCALAVWRYQGFRNPWNRAGTAEGVSPLADPFVRRLSSCGPIAVVVLMVLSMTLPGLAEQSRLYQYVGYSFTTLMSFLMVLALDQDRGWFGKTFSAPRLGALGRVSYGFYIWHWPVCVIVGYKLEPRIGSVLAAVAVWIVSLGLALLSWNLVEVPVQRWRSAQLKKKKAQRAPELTAVLPTDVLQSGSKGSSL